MKLIPHWRHVDRVVDRLVPSALHDQNDVRHARVAVWVSAILLFTACLWIVVNTLLGLTVAIPFIVVGAILLMLAPVTLRLSVVLAAHQIAFTLLLTVLGIAWFRSKQEAPATVFVTVCPLLATLCGGKRAGFVWLAVIGIALCGLSLFGRAEAMQSPLAKVWIARPLATFTCAVAIQLCAVAYEAMHERMLSQLRSTNAELEQQHLESKKQLLEIGLLNSKLAQEHRAAQEVAAKLEIARAQAERASRAKSTFLANVSHELRTPMNAVFGMTESMLEGELQPEQQARAQTILAAGRTLLAIINDVLDMSKIEAGQLRLHTTDVNTSALVENVLAAVRVFAEVKELALCVELDGLPAQPVRCDELRLRQVLINLLSNAIKFTPNGSVTLRVKATSETADAVRLHFSVRDTGIGMDEETARRVFGAFEQGDESTTRKFGGTGLGLSISQNLVALMGGELTVRTAPHQGTEFEFSVVTPLAAAPSEPQTAEASAERSARIRARNLQVLVAEDNSINLMLLERVLVQLGCRVATVVNGAQAAARLTCDHTFDLVFMDWQMPELDGLAATEQIRQWESANGKPRTRIIGFTASAFDEEIARCRSVGMDGVLTKPVVRDQIEQVLHQQTTA